MLPTRAERVDSVAATAVSSSVGLSGPEEEEFFGPLGIASLTAEALFIGHDLLVSGVASKRE